MLAVPVAQAGSSPRVRGTPGARPGWAFHQRFIPAGAGNAWPGRRPMRIRTVHPRGCGERFVAKDHTSFAAGSSPRVRGTPLPGLLPSPRRRFIPAGAGNAHHMSGPSFGAAVHPRGCGERPAVATMNPLSSGSSPRVRGTHCHIARRDAPNRFIPAGAGNALPGVNVSAPASVHPRGCGERSAHGSNIGYDHGSSPRVRGTPLRGLDGLLDRRFIPAGAGNARVPCAGALPRSVHPRGCGEREPDLLIVDYPNGSSPRVRGTLRPAVDGGHVRRFIPAGAGNASTFLALRPSTTVHPRGCGERADIQEGGNGASGSSPRVRGTPQTELHEVQHHRFIPAGAGNAVSCSCTTTRPPVHPRGCGERVGEDHRPKPGAGSSPRVRGTRG